MSAPKKVTTQLGHGTADDVLVRGRSLTRELIGRCSFSEMLYFHVVGRRPSAGEVAVVDACLVTLMEHGLTPTAITARMTYTSAPESMQTAVAAGLASVGSLFLGTVERCALLLARMVASDDVEVEASAIVEEHRRSETPLPGFGHPVHHPEDPRTPVLLAVAHAHGVAGDHVDALCVLAHVVDRAYGRHITVNATGAVAAALSDCGVPAEILRGFALVSRCAGLVAHVREEQLRPATFSLWQAGETAVPYDAPPIDRDDVTPDDDRDEENR